MNVKILFILPCLAVVLMLSSCGSVEDESKINDYEILSISLSDTELSMKEEDEAILVVSPEIRAPDGMIIPAQQDFQWSSSDEDIVNIENCRQETCKLIAVSEGTATITAKSVKSGLTAKCVVTVNPILYSSQRIVFVGDTLQLKSTILSEKAKSKSLTWKTSNYNIATVNGDGIVQTLGTGDVIITAITNSDNVRVQCEVKVKSLVEGSVNLGLSVLWSKTNLGAGSDTEAGYYFQWGVTEPMPNGEIVEYKYHHTETYTDEQGYTHTKDIWDDLGENISGTEYDAARTIWGDNWRMPTRAEARELIEKCVWELVTKDGHEGYKVTGPNGNHIFIYLAGYHPSGMFGAYAKQVGVYGIYWLGHGWPAKNGGQEANVLNLGPHSGVGYDTYSYEKDYGCTIRPVSDGF